MTFRDFVDDGENYCKTDYGLFPGNYRSFYKRYYPIIIFVALQLIQILHTLYHYKNFKKLPKIQTIPYLILLSITTITSIHLLFKYILIPFYMQSLVFNPEFCVFFAISQYVYIFMFQAAVLSILILRIEVIFKNTTVVAISKRSKYTALSLINGIFIILTILFFVFINKPCIRIWDPRDFDETEYLYYCNAYPSDQGNSIALYVGYAGIAYILLSTVIMGFYFTFKLRQAWSLVSGTKSKSDRIYIVMKKNTILTVCICLSTLINWSIFFFYGGANEWSFLLDMYINPVCISLMFRFNEWIYDTVFFCGGISCCDKKKGKQFETSMGHLKKPPIELDNVRSNSAKTVEGV